jgi:prepilin signal peptidase PulO-like enzyme (type II secretory pathway)
LLLVLGPAGAVTPLGWCSLAAAGALAGAAALLGARRPRLPFAAAIAIAAIDVGTLTLHAGSVSTR